MILLMIVHRDYWEEIFNKRLFLVLNSLDIKLNVDKIS